MTVLSSTAKNKLFCVVLSWFGLFGVDCAAALPIGPVLVIAPHPDDETIGCGALLARFCAEGRKVRVVIVTDGRASTNSFLISPDDLAAIRRKESLGAAEKLGLSPDDVFFLSYPDGGVASHIDAVSRDIAFHIARFSPAIVFTAHCFDEHEDHRALSLIAGRLQDEGERSFLLFQYPVWYRAMSLPFGILRCLATPSLYRCCRLFRAEGFRKNKEAALSQYRSQFENLTGEKCWRFFSAATRERFCAPLEMFFERAGRKINKQFPAKT